MKRTFFISILVSYIVGLLMVPAHATTSDKVVVYYFYTDYRCSRCYKFQLYTKEAVDKYFADEVRKGTVEFKAINTDKKEYSHFAKDYQLYTKSVIISLAKEGKEQKYKNLGKIWEYVNNKNEFYEYIQTEVNNYLIELNQ